MCTRKVDKFCGMLGAIVLLLFIGWLLIGIELWLSDYEQPWEVKVDTSDNTYYAERTTYFLRTHQYAPVIKHNQTWYIRVNGKWNELYEVSDIDCPDTDDRYHR